jgi:hypothetical protein
MPVERADKGAEAVEAGEMTEYGVTIHPFAEAAANIVAAGDFAERVD